MPVFGFQVLLKTKLWPYPHGIWITGILSQTTTGNKQTKTVTITTKQINSPFPTPTTPDPEGHENECYLFHSLQLFYTLYRNNAIKYYMAYNKAKVNVTIERQNSRQNRGESNVKTGRHLKLPLL